MKKRIFIFLFFLLCLIPSVGILLIGPAQPGANETLPVAPHLTDETGAWNRRILGDTADYLEKHFALRQEMVTLNHALSAVVFRTSPEEDVIIGKDGWLFYGETLEDYEGIHGMSRRELWSAAHTLALMREYCESKGVKFLFTVAPNKNSLYGTYMPERYPTGEGRRNIDGLVPLLASEGVPYADLFFPLSQEAVLYRKLDSHWTQQGAGLAGDCLLSALGQEAPAFYGGETRPVCEETGDLYEMLYPKGRRLDEDPVYTRGFTFSYTAPIRSTEDNMIRTTCMDRSGSLLMFRDSFGNALHLFLAEGFGQATFCRLTPYNLGLIHTEAADTVVIELVERNLDWLITRPPIFPAPVRILPGEKSMDAGLLFDLIVEDTEDLAGYVKLSGSLTSPAPEQDSHVYLQVGDTIYEATPTGETSFQAYIPQNTLSQTVSLLLAWDGRILEGQVTNE